jgi:hypothetical protein
MFWNCCGYDRCFLCKIVPQAASGMNIMDICDVDNYLYLMQFDPKHTFLSLGSALLVEYYHVTWTVKHYIARQHLHSTVTLDKLVR